MHMDDSSNLHGSGAGVILEGPNGISLDQSLRFGFKANCNLVEYEDLLARLRPSKEVNAQRVSCRNDSKVTTE